MIARTAARWQTSDWQQVMKTMIRSVDELCDALALDPATLDLDPAAQQAFALRVPRPFVALMEKGNSRDPLLLQVLPQAQEMQPVPGFVADPLQEASFNPVPGLVHKYRGRVLLISSPACAVHCRYCFRRHFPYQANTPGLADWQQALDYIAADPSIVEVILSGGDPLSASDDYLAGLISRLAAIDHVSYLRIHTRLPVVVPQRVTDGLLQALTGSRLQPTMVIHANHAQELSADVAESLALLRQAGIRLLNQSVLLAGVNDSEASLRALLERLHQIQVEAYYLHLLDAVEGAAHFQLPQARALALYEALRRQLPGFMLPRLVRETPHAPYKTWL
ncbi:MAG TPA: EF-P beta-lysylation protein EpmB [Pseudomonadales bacterium]